MAVDEVAASLVQKVRDAAKPRSLKDLTEEEVYDLARVTLTKADIVAWMQSLSPLPEEEAQAEALVLEAWALDNVIARHSTE